LPCAAREGHSLFAVCRVADAALMPAPGQCLLRETDIGRVVTYEKVLWQWFHRPGSPLLIVMTGRQIELKIKTTTILKLHPTFPPKCSGHAGRAPVDAVAYAYLRAWT